jgi:hypothetical protein
MGNGGGPPLELDAADYDVIKNGTVVTRGTYIGCIQVGKVYHWVIAAGSAWDLKNGVPESGYSKITDSVWDQCQDNGTLDWDGQNECWEHPETGDTYRWADDDGTVALVEYEP